MNFLKKLIALVKIHKVHHPLLVCNDLCCVIESSVKSCMTKNTVTIDVKGSLLEAAKLMAQHNISVLVVQDYGTDIGVLTESNLADDVILKKMNPNTSLKKVTMEPIVWLQSSASVLDAYLMMSKAGVRNVLIQSGRTPVGILTETDLCQLLNVFSNLPLQYAPLLKHIMRKKVATIAPAATIQKVRLLMHKNNVNSVLVMDKGKAAGIITARDLVYHIAHKKKPLNTPAKKIMKKPIVSGTQEMNVFDANDTMISDSIRRLPIIEKGVVKGIVTEQEVLDAMCSYIIDMRCFIRPLENKE